jgi:hypothetical protein
MSEDKVVAEGRAMENQEVKRLGKGEIGIVDAIKFTVTQLLAFLTDGDKPATLKN